MIHLIVCNYIDSLTNRKVVNNDCRAIQCEYSNTSYIAYSKNEHHKALLFGVLNKNLSNLSTVFPLSNISLYFGILALPPPQKNPSNYNSSFIIENKVQQVRFIYKFAFWVNRFPSFLSSNFIPCMLSMSSCRANCKPFLLYFLLLSKCL